MNTDGNPFEGCVLTDASFATRITAIPDPLTGRPYKCPRANVLRIMYWLTRELGGPDGGTIIAGLLREANVWHEGEELTL